MGKHSKKKKYSRQNPSSTKTPYSTVTSEIDENNDSEDTLLKIANNLKAGKAILGSRLLNTLGKDIP